MEPVKIGFIGAGDVSLLHSQAVEKCPGAELAGLWSIDEALNRDKAARFGCRVYPDPEALVSDPGIDAVLILTNLESHTQYALQAIDAGKHVLIEKPVAPTLAEIDKLRDAAAARGVVAMPGHNYIYEPGIQRTRNLLGSGKLGDLVSVHILYNIHHPEEIARRYPGVIRHILTHHCYILLYLAGLPQSLSALSSVIHYEDFREEDLAMANLKMKSGALAHFSASFAADDNASDPWTFVVKVIGTGGATRFSYRDWVENMPGPVHAHTWSAYQSGIDNEVAHFVQDCIAKGAPPLSSLDDAAVCLRIIEACETSIAEARTVDL